MPNDFKVFNDLNDLNDSGSPITLTLIYPNQNNLKNLHAMEEMFDEIKNEVVGSRRMKEFLGELKEKAHAFYAILHKSPERFVKIVYNDDWCDTVASLTVAEFENRWEQFVSEDLRVMLSFRTFYSKVERDSHIFEIDDSDRDWLGEDEYDFGCTSQLEYSVWSEQIPYILTAICRDAIIAGHPFVIDDETIAEYGFTDADVEYLKDMVARINNDTMSEFKENYWRLKRIVEQYHA